MKYKILIIASLFCLPLLGQTPCPDEVGISTNPESPVNLFGEPWLNNGDFDWKIRHFDWFQSTNGDILSVISPFWGANNPNTDEIEINPDYLDYNSSDGWELLAYDFGKSYGPPYYIDGRDHPTFILYNRYTGIVRVFMYIVKASATGGNLQSVDYQNAHIELTHDVDPAKGGYNTAILAHAERVAAPLDNFTKNLQFSAVNELHIAGGMWVMADFPLAYDPCGCQNEGVSKLEFNARLVYNSTIELSGKVSTGSETSVIVENGGENKGSNSGASFYGGIKTNTDKIQTAIKRGTNTRSLIDSWYKLRGYDLNDQKGSKIEGVDLKEYQELIGFLPYVDVAIGLLDFFVGGGKSTNKENPTVVLFEAGVNAEGTIESEGNASGIQIVTPGTVRNPSTNPAYTPAEIPVYN